MMSPSTSLVAAALAFVIPASALIFPRATNTTRVSIPLQNAGNQMYMAPVKMGSSTGAQQFGFVLSTTAAYTYVAGNNCTSCSTNTSAPTYNPALSATYQPPPATAANGGQVQVTLNGKKVLGALGTENCAFQRADGTWWQYPNQAVVVAGSGSDSSSIPSSGLAGFGQSQVPTATDSLVGQYLAGHPDLNGTFTFGLALNSNDQASNNDGSDSSGGALHIFQPDQSYYTGSVATVPVATTSQQGNFGQLPPQLSSYDWTIQLGGWTFNPGSGQDVSGGQGTFVTVEPAYPYIKLTEQDATNIYAAIPGAQPYTVPDGAVTSSGVAYTQDPNSVSWSIPCSLSGASLAMNIAGVTINVAPSDLFTSVGGVCVGNVKGWSNFTASTYIFGSAFLRSAYLVFTANSDSQTNSIGFATRAFAEKSSKSEAGPIAGGVVGGVVFLLLVGLGIFLFLRRKRQSEIPPSASYAGGTTEKSHSWFGFGSTKDKNEDHLVAEPWVGGGGGGPNSTSGGAHSSEGGVTVQPWNPNAPTEQAFLSPSGTATNFSGTTPSPGPLQQQQAAAPAGGYNYDRPSMGSGGYSPVPNTAATGGHIPQAMWVERS